MVVERDTASDTGPGGPKTLLGLKPTGLSVFSGKNQVLVFEFFPSPMLISASGHGGAY